MAEEWKVNQVWCIQKIQSMQLEPSILILGISLIMMIKNSRSNKPRINKRRKSRTRKLLPVLLNMERILYALSVVDLTRSHNARNKIYLKVIGGLLNIKPIMLK